MRKLILTLGLVLVTISSFAQSTNEHFDKLSKIDTLSGEIRRTLRDYYTECQDKNFFHEGYGIVKAVFFQDTVGIDVISLTAVLDDRYTEAPTPYYAVIDGHFFLMYRGDSKGRIIETGSDQTLISQMNSLLRGRTYLRPLQNTRYNEFTGPDGKVKKRPEIQILGGNHWNTTLFYFSDGKLKKVVKPV